MDERAARDALALAGELEPQLRGLDREAAFARFAESGADLLAAVEYYVASNAAEEAIRLARRIAPLLQATGRLDEAIDRLERALAVPGRGRGGARPRLRRSRASLLLARGRPPLGRTLPAGDRHR